MPSLTLANSLRATITYSPFSPASLFSGGAPGVWYDPSDYSTLFQDSAGTTPVTAVEQPVGLMLDKSQGLVLGPELVADYTTGYTASGTANVTVSAGEVIATADGSSANPGYYYAITTVVGQQYYVTGVLRSPTTNTMYLGANSSTSMGSNINRASSFSASSTQVGFFFTAVGTTTYIFVYGSTGTVGNAYAGRNISVKYRPGNHAFQSTSASRPVLSARYNLLTKTEQFGDAAWTKTNITVTANATTDPLGGNTADLISLTGATATKFIFQSASVIVPRVASIYLKAGTHNFVQLMFDGGSAQANFNVSTGEAGVVSGGTSTITPVGNGWFFVQFTSSATGSLRIYAVDNNSAAWASTTSSTGNFYIWGASLVPSNQSTLPYQRVNTSTDYATTGFLPYLKFDGVDDSLSTNSISFTSTDKISAFAGARKLSNTAYELLYETSIRPDLNNGAFGCFATDGTSGTYGFNLRGTSGVYYVPTGYTAPITSVLSCLNDIGGASLATELIPRINGALAQVGGGGTTAGTGNFGNYPLFIGRRNNATNPFNGQLYSMIIVGKQVTATELSSTETYTAIKTGVTLA